MAVKNIIEQNITSLLKLDYLPLEKKAELMDKIVEVVTKSVLLRARNAMDETKKVEFDKILDEGSDDELQTFITNNIPDFIVMLGEETEKIKKSMLSSLQ